AEAIDEGVEMIFLTAPNAIEMVDGRKQLHCIRMELGEPDRSGRRRPVPIEGSDFTIGADTIIGAIGQSTNTQFLYNDLPVRLNKWGDIDIDGSTMEASENKIFAGGDCVTGPATLIEALDAGNKAARSIDAYLQGRTLEPEVSFKGIDVGMQRAMGFIDACAQEKVTLLDPKERLKGFAEVEGPYSDAAAMKEANRCLRCYRLAVWE
ncbi:MAG TPA: FAD-dependent oxidoreductase, partial [Candidatus Ozemobacteraceae bacterium]